MTMAQRRPILLLVALEGRGYLGGRHLLDAERRSCSIGAVAAALKPALNRLLSSLLKNEQE